MSNNHPTPKPNRETGEFYLASGKVIKCRPVPAAAYIRMKEEFPPPLPPVQMTEAGPVRNEKHSSYLKALEEYQELLGKRAIEIYIELGIAPGQFEINKAEIDDMRESMRQVGLPIDKLSDKAVYVTYFLVPEENELGSLYAFISSLGKPTAEEVALHRDSFPGNLPEKGE